MRRSRIVGAAFMTLALVILIGVAVRGALASPVAASAGLGCPAPLAGAPPGFCVDLPSVTTTSRHATPSDTLGLLDQLPACGRQGRLLPSFCVDLPSTSLIAPSATAPAATSTGSGAPCPQLPPGQAPIFCLGALAVADGPAARQARVAYLVEQGGLGTRDAHAVGLHLQIDTLIGAGDAEHIRTRAQDDEKAVAAYFGRGFDTPPVVFVLATRASYASALQRLLHYSAANAAALAIQSGGLYVSDPSVIFVNWENVNAANSLLVIRHELSHALLREIVGPQAAVPAWVDEGLATVVQNSALPRSSAIDVGSYVALALLAEHRTSLDELTSLDEWPMRNAALGGYGYRVGELAARELIRHISLPVLIRVLAAQRVAGSFAQAYARVTGASYASFLASFAAQVASCGPSIVTGAADGARNVPYLARGFGAKRDVRIAIVGRSGYHVEFSVRTDDYGLYAGTFGSTAAAGRYEIAAVDGALDTRVVIDTAAGTALAPPLAISFCGD